MQVRLQMQVLQEGVQACLRKILQGSQILQEMQKVRQEVFQKVQVLWIQVCMQEVLEGVRFKAQELYCLDSEPR